MCVVLIVPTALRRGSSLRSQALPLAQVVLGRVIVETDGQQRLKAQLTKVPWRGIAMSERTRESTQPARLAYSSTQRLPLAVSQSTG
jgi:hypothetical protein